MGSIEEKYHRAVRTTNLRSRSEGSPDADVIHAAGTADGLGTMLMRLRAEFDSINRQELKHADRTTAKAFTLVALNSLVPARQALGAYAIREAARRAPAATTPEVYAIVGQVIDRFLDPLCAPCDGRGTIGAFGEPQLRCAACRGSGKRRQIDFGTDEAQNAFGHWLGAEFDRKITSAAARIHAKTRDA